MTNFDLNTVIQTLRSSRWHVVISLSWSLISLSEPMPGSFPLSCSGLSTCLLVVVACTFIGNVRSIYRLQPPRMLLRFPLFCQCVTGPSMVSTKPIVSPEKCSTQSVMRDVPRAVHISMGLCLASFLTLAPQLTHFQVWFFIYVAYFFVIDILTLLPKFVHESGGVAGNHCAEVTPLPLTLAGPFSVALVA